MDTQRTKISAFIYKLIGGEVGGREGGEVGGATHSGMRRVPDTRAPFSLQSTSRFYCESSPAAAVSDDVSVDVSLDVSVTVTVSVSALVAASLFALVSCTFHSIMFT